MGKHIAIPHMFPVLPEHIEIQTLISEHHDMFVSLNNLRYVVETLVKDEGEKKILLADLEDLYQFLCGSLETHVVDADGRKN